MVQADLAPGDAKSVGFDSQGVELHYIRSREDPLFETAFQMLWEEFGAKGEMESIDVIARRLAWKPEPRSTGEFLRYELLLLTHDGTPIAVRDHTAIVDPGFSQAVVHMSHNLVSVPWRRTGIAGWMRALPIQAARACMDQAAMSHPLPVTLVAEMEPADPTDPDRTTRLAAYGKAGYWKVDPQRVQYIQPDFRTPDEIDASGGPCPLPLCLLVRRIGRENERSISGWEVREIAELLYRMYASEFRTADMRPVNASLNAYPPAADAIPLVQPSLV